MEAIEALESAEILAASPPAKRPRHEVDTLLVKKEKFCGDEVEAPEGEYSNLGIGPLQLAKVEGDEDAGRKFSEKCSGCGRDPTCACWRRPGELCEWALPKDRGSWCKDCYSVFRTWFTNFKSVTLFAVWLDTDDNWQEFVQVLVSYLSLANEGQTQIRKTMIEKRLVTLRWVFSFLGVPFGTFVVKLVREKSLSDMSSLIQVMGDDTLEIGVLQKARPDRKLLPSASFIDAVAPAGIARWPPSLRFQVLGQSGQLHAAAGAVVAVHAEPSSSASSDADPSLQKALVSFPEKKLQLQQEAVKKVLSSVWSSPMWNDLSKESQFTPLIAKFNAIMLDGVADGKKQLEQECHMWMVGLANGKSFTRFWKIFNKHRKHIQYMSCQQPLDKFVAFLHEVGVETHATIDLHCLKLNLFARVAAKEAEFEVIFCHFVEQHMGDVISLLGSASNQNDPQVWVRDAFFTAFALTLTEAPADELDEQRPAIAMKLKSIMASLRGYNDYDFGLFCEDLHHCILLFGLTPESCLTTAADISNALKAVMESPRLARLLKFWTSSPVGIQIRDVAQKLLEMRAGDELGAKKLQKAIACLRDPSNLYLKRVESERNMPESEETKIQVVFVLHNIDRLLDSSVIAMMAESMTTAVEGLQRFTSQVQLEGQSQALSSWSTELAKLAGYCSHGLLVLAWNAIGSSLSRLGAVDSEAGEHQTFEASKPLLAEMHAKLEIMRPLTTSTTWRCTMTMLGNLIKEHRKKFCSEVITALEATVAHITCASKFFQVFVSFFDSFASLRSVDFPSEYSLSVQEWRVMRSAGKSGSFLDTLVGMKHELRRMEEFFSQGWGVSAVPEPEVDNWVLQFASKPSDIISYRSALSMFDCITSCPIIKVSLETLKGMMVEVLRALMIALGLHGVRSMTIAKVEEMLCTNKSMVEICDSFAKVASMSDDIRGFKRSLTDANFTTSAVALYDILSDLVQECGDVDMDLATIFNGLFTEPVVEKAITIQQLLHILKMYCSLRQCCLAIGHLKIEGFGSKAGCLDKGQLKVEVDAAIGVLDDDLKRIHAMMIAEEMTAIQAMALPLVLGLQEVESWIDAAFSFSSHVKKACVHALMEHAYELADRAIKLTPAYSHLVTDYVYHPRLAKKNLVKPAENEKLTHCVIELVKSMSKAASAHKGWGLTPDFESDPELSEHRSYCNSAFKAAKKAMVVIAGVKAVEVLEGEDQLKEVTKIVDNRKDEVPAALRDILVSIKNKGVK